MRFARSVSLAAAAALCAGCGGASSEGAPTTDLASVVRPATTVAEPPLYPLPAKPAYPEPCPPPKRKPGKPGKLPKAKVATADLPRPVALKKRTVDLAPLEGKGMWLTTWAETKVDVPALVEQATAGGLTQVWVRTGGARQGWYGRPLLTELLPAAHKAGLSVVAWDFPTLSDPMVDVARARKAITGTFAGHSLDGFSPDIETINEGTFNSAERVKLYLSYVRKYAGNMPIVSTVMRPTDYMLDAFPYKAQVPYVDAFAPMVYWSCNEPGKLAKESVERLADLRPVHLVGQSYDMGPEGGRQGMPTGKEIWRFLDAGKRAGALGASLYNYDQAGKAQWKSLSRYPWE